MSRSRIKNVSVREQLKTCQFDLEKALSTGNPAIHNNKHCVVRVNERVSNMRLIGLRCFSGVFEIIPRRKKRKLFSLIFCTVICTIVEMESPTLSAKSDEFNYGIKSTIAQVNIYIIITLAINRRYLRLLIRMKNIRDFLRSFFAGRSVVYVVSVQHENRNRHDGTRNNHRSRDQTKL